MMLKQVSDIPSTLSIWLKLLGFCVLLFRRANAIGLTDFATGEPWGVFVCPAVSPARFSHSLRLEPGNDTRTKPWKKDRAKVDVARERSMSRIVFDWNSDSNVLETFLSNEVGGKNESRREEVVKREKIVEKKSEEKWRLFLMERRKNSIRNVTFVIISILERKIFEITSVNIRLQKRKQYERTIPKLCNLEKIGTVIAHRTIG